MRERFRKSALSAAIWGLLLLGIGDDARAPIRPVSDAYFGTSVVDPYRYMETGDPGYLAWKKQRLAQTQAMLHEARMRAGFDGKSPASPRRLEQLAVVRGHAFYLTYATEGAELVERDVHGGAARTIATGARFDSAAGPGALGAFAVSNDARSIAIHVYSGRVADSDIHVLRTADGSETEPPLHHTIYDYVGFTPDDRCLVYAASPERSSRTSITVPGNAYDYKHCIGSKQNDDALIFGPKISPLVRVPSHAFTFVDTTGPQAVAEVRDPAAVGSRFYVAPTALLGKPGTPWRPLGDAKAGYTDYAIHGTTIDLVTNHGAPNYAVVRASLTGPFTPRIVLPASPTVIVSGTLDGIPKAGIFSLFAAADADYVQLLDRGVSRMVRIPYDAKATPIAVPLPLNGSILEAATDAHRPGVLLDLTSWTSAGDVYAYDPARTAATPTGFVSPATAEPRVSEELTATASDGTQIPISVVHRPGIKLDGTHPLVLRTAGAYGFSFTPDYDAVPEAWLAHGGIFAVAHIRGGGELGESWHRAAMGARKSTSWNDLIAVAHRLIDAGYTSPHRLNLYGTVQSYLGGIASSIVIGRAIEEQPSLFAAAVVDAPVFDLLRSERTQLGRQSIGEFGSVANADGFAALQAMSPYEHVQSGTVFPPMLIRSLQHYGFGDDWQAAKMVARYDEAAGRLDAAYLDTPGESAGDKRSRADLRDDAFAFFLSEDAKNITAGVAVKLIAINDFHGYLEATETLKVPDPANPSATITEPVGGAAYLATAVKKLEAENPRHVVVGAGDMVGASPLGSALFHDEATIQVLNAIGLEYTSVGNHEFDEGKAELLRKQRGGCHPGSAIGKETCFIDGAFRGATYEYLAANVIDDDTGKTLFPSYAIKRIDTGDGHQLPIAFIGVVLKGTPTVTTDFGVRGLHFTDEADAINALIPEIHAQGVHAIVVLIHQGIATKVGFDDHSCAGAVGDLLPILDRLDPSIKLVVSGHTHRAYICPHGEGTQHSSVFYTSAGKYGQAVSDIDLTIDPATDTITSIDAHNHLIVNDSAPNPAPAAYPAFASDPKIASLVERYSAATKPLVNRVVGHITADFTADGSAFASGGSGESALGDLIADARLESTRSHGAVAAFIDEGGIRSPLRVRAVDGSKTPGDVLFGETYAVEPFGDLLYTETLTGAQIYTLLAEQFTQKTSSESLSVSRGFHYVWDAQLPDGTSKVVPGSVTIDGKPVVLTQTYRVTVDSFLLGGGDGFVVLANGTDRIAGDIDHAVLNAYVAAHSPLSPSPRDRIVRLH